MATITIQRHANTAVTTYAVDFRLTESVRAVRLNHKNGKIGYSGGARISSQLRTLDQRAEALAERIFAIDGVVPGNELVGGNTVTISRNSVMVERDTTSTTDEGIEAQVVAILEQTAGIPAGSATVIIDEHQRSAEYAEQLQRANREIEEYSIIEPDYDSLDEGSLYSY